MSAKLRSFWLDSNAYAFNLLVGLLDSYGDDALYWTPETIEMHLVQDFNLGEVPDAIFDRLMTAICILTNNSFFVSETDFAKDCVALSGTFVRADEWPMPTAADVAWGINEALLILPLEPNETDPFSAEIVGFIGEILSAEGISKPPGVLRVAKLPAQLAALVDHQFSDDPEMYSMISAAERDKSEAIDKLIRSRLSDLLNQLFHLPLRHGKTEFMRRILGRLEPVDE